MDNAKRISCCALNVNGLGSTGKQSKLKLWIKQVADVVVLADSRIAADHNFWAELRPKSFAAVGPATKAGGVAIISFKEGLLLKEVKAHASGRLVRAKLTWGDLEFTLVAAYFPAQAHLRGPFFREVLQPFVSNVPLTEQLVVAGDFNLVEDPELDKSSRLGTSGENDRFLAACNGHKVVDVFRALHPVKREFTFFSKSALTSSRIDRMVVSQSLLHRVQVAAHKLIPWGVSDHWFGIRMVISTDEQRQEGPGIWRLKASQVGKPGVRRIVEAVVRKQGLGQSRVFKELQVQLGVAMRSHEKEEKKRVAAVRVHLENRVELLRHEVMGDSKNQVKKEALLKAEVQWKSYGEAARECLLLMAGTRRELDGETPSRFLSAKVKTRKSKTLIAELVHKGNPVSDKRGILSAAADHFREAFGPSPAADQGWAAEKHMVLTDQEGEHLVREWGEEEVKSALKGMALNKSPGSDGLPKELYEQHWDLLGGSLVSFVKEFEKSAVLPAKAKEAVTILLHKKGPTTELGNYRPITLLNCTYKLVARLLADRMKPVLDRVISKEQYGFIAGRHLADAVSLVADIITAAKAGKEDWYLLLVDFQKAYDSISRTYLVKTLERMRFPGRFIEWVEGLHQGTHTRLCVNGWLSEAVDVEKGVRQGCPLAPYLFLCAVEPLCQEAARRQLGLRMKGQGRLAYMGYADDTTLLLNGKRQLEKAEGLLREFEEVSGLKTNVGKSVVLPVGKNVGKGQPPGSGFKWAKCGEVERLLGVWVSPCGDFTATWDKAVERARVELHKWQQQYLTTTARVAVINCYIMPIFLFQAQVYPPPGEVWRKVLKLCHNFVSSGVATEENRFVLWSRLLMLQSKKAGGLGVVDPTRRLDSLAVQRVGKLLLEENKIKQDLGIRAADLKVGWAGFYAHRDICKRDKGEASRWGKTKEIFLKSVFAQVPEAVSRWDYEEEQLAFNRRILFRGNSPFGNQVEAKGLVGVKMGDLVERKADGSRARKSEGALLRELGDKKLVRWAWKAFEAAPEVWRSVLLAPVEAREILAVSSVVATAGYRGSGPSFWDIVEVRGEVMVCSKVYVDAGGTVTRSADPWSMELRWRDVVPVVVQGGRIIGEAGKPRTRLLGTSLCWGGEVMKLKRIRQCLPGPEASRAKQLGWEERWGRSIDWRRWIEVRESRVTPAKCRDVMLKVHSLNLQVGERLPFLANGGACPHCGEFETLEHCLFNCPRIRPIIAALKRTLHVINPRRQIGSLGDLLFKECGSKSGFSEATITAVTIHRIWADRCLAVFEKKKLQPGKAMRRITTAFRLHARVYSFVKGREGMKKDPKGCAGKRGQLDADEDRLLGRIKDRHARSMTWSRTFQPIWADPRTFRKPP